MSTISLRGITLGLDDHGGGANALLLVHGHPFDRSMWLPQVEPAKRAGWRVIAPDLRGYGETTVVEGRTPFAEFAADLAALLDHLEVQQVVLAGLSMGGQVVMEFARLYPSRVRGLVLAATFPQAETEDGRRNRNAAADRLLREGMDPYAEEVLPRMLASRSIETLPTVAHHVMRMMRATDPEGAAAALRGRAERPSYDATLAALRVPALVVVGSEDAFTTRHDAERMRDLITGSELLWMEGSGHMPNLEQPDVFNAGLLRLLERVGRLEQ
ncbi:MAG: hydrolase [Gemmatimonadetes bacterium]|nr:hydrolase [Gemmatimonadota bacterium]